LQAIAVQKSLSGKCRNRCGLLEQSNWPVSPTVHKSEPGDAPGNVFSALYFMKPA
jgi:hypothetical protein